MLQNLQNMGFFLYLFPFLLALAIFFGILTYAAGDKMPKSAISLISIILAFFVMLYASWNVALVSFFANLSGAGLVIGSGIIFLIILFGLLGFKTEDLFKGDKSKWVFILVIIVIAILIFFAAGGAQFGLIPSWASNSEFLTIVFFVIIIALAMWFMGGGEKDKSGGAPSGGNAGGGSR
ncbi:MAG: hypothetical protein ABIH52_01535 [Candidatus Aenigmatarchaeota archaeon]